MTRDELGRFLDTLSIGEAANIPDTDLREAFCPVSKAEQLRSFIDQHSCHLIWESNGVTVVKRRNERGRPVEFEKDKSTDQQ